MSESNALPSPFVFGLDELLLTIALAMILIPFQQQIHRYIDSSHVVSISDLSPDGRALAAVSRAGNVVFDLPSGRVLYDLPEGTRAARFSEDGRFLLASPDKGIIVLDARSGERVGSFAESSDPWEYRLSPGANQGLWLEDSKRGLGLQDLEKGNSSRLSISIPDGWVIRTLAYVEGGRTVVAQGQSPGQPPTLRLWAASSGEAIGQFSLPPVRPVSMVAYPNGPLVAVSHFQRVSILEIPSGNEVANIQKLPPYWIPRRFSQDGRLLAIPIRGVGFAAAHRGGIEIWDVESGRLKDFVQTSLWATDVAILDGGRRIVTLEGYNSVEFFWGGADHVSYYDVATGKRELRVSGLYLRVWPLSWILDCSLAVWLFLWLAANRRRRRSSDQPTRGWDWGAYILAFLAVAFFTNGYFLAWMRMETFYSPLLTTCFWLLLLSCTALLLYLALAIVQGLRRR
ncbi:MAG: hypothetical protein O6952_02250, partial [Planctomycetota bacterium]|nr:hypothetical protein [Planctomycetota bacterium]